MRQGFLLFWQNEDGQATVEYVVLISAMVGTAVMVVRTFLGPLYTRMVNSISNQIENQIFGANLHTFRIRK